jgi:hypothetical protein
MNGRPKPGASRGDERGSPSAPGILNPSRCCPRCGGEIIVEPLLSTSFCGLRLKARCPAGCRWSEQEQIELDHAADEALYG